jgi:Domain of unknown function (DUF4337)
MSVNEELEEHAQHAHDYFSRKVGATMAIIAAVLAVVAVYAHINTTEELLAQQKSSDQWAFYQAKALRRYQSEVARDILKSIGSARTEETAEKYAKDFERYEKEAEKIQEEAREYGQESELAGRRALRFHAGEVFLEIAIVLTSLAILTRKNMFWLAGVLVASSGAIISLTSFMIRQLP